MLYFCKKEITYYKVLVGNVSNENKIDTTAAWYDLFNLGTAFALRACLIQTEASSFET